MNDTSRAKPYPDPDRGTPEPRRPVPGPPEGERSPAAPEGGPVVHTPRQPAAPECAPFVHNPPGDPVAPGDPAAPRDPRPPGDPAAGDATAPGDPAAGEPAAPGEPGPRALAGTGEPAAKGPGPLGPSRRVSSAIRTVPNAVTLLRLLLMPVCAYLLGTGRYGWGLALTAVVGSTDWVDGWLARRTGQVSRVGQLLDPLADRLLIASVAVALVVRGVLPWPAAVLLLARDLLLLAGWPLLKRRGIEPPEVVFIGKAATLVLLVALPVLTLGATGLAVAGVAHLLGLALLWVGVAMYYLAGAVYVRMVLERLGHRAGAGS
jgi:cardiolipin synthase (CMP-forming)